MLTRSLLKKRIVRFAAEPLGRLTDRFRLPCSHPALPSGAFHQSPSATAAELDRYGALIDRWLERELPDNPMLAHVDREPAERRWFVRLRGEERDVSTIWLTLGNYTLHYETYFMPAPEENREECFDFLLRRSARLYGMRFAIGPEDAVYLVGQMPRRGRGGARSHRGLHLGLPRAVLPPRHAHRLWLALPRVTGRAGRLPPRGAGAKVRSGPEGRNGRSRSGKCG